MRKATKHKGPVVSFTKNPSFYISLAVAFVILAAATFGSNYATGSDTKWSLLTSQAIVEHGTIRLDAYLGVMGDLNYQVQQKNGHYYYFFPLGTPLVAVPFVAGANVFGADMVRYEHHLQIAMAALVLLASYWVMGRIAGLYLSKTASALCSAAFLLGSSFMSTGATALWSHDLAALFALISIYSVFKGRASEKHPYGWLTAFTLFLAYLCRPTLGLLAPVLIGVQFFFFNKKGAIQTAMVLCGLLILFAAFSWHVFHQLLPDYYMPQRLGDSDFRRAVYGNLLSPARGLLVYSPFLIFPLLSVVSMWRKHPQYRGELCLLLWPVLHLVAISNFHHWWAGHSFGPRLMYDALPGLFLLYVLFVRGLKLQSWKGFAMAAAVFFAVAVNSGQGVFNRYAALWNTLHNVDRNPELVFDWRYPQFVHTKARHKARFAAFSKANLPRLMEKSKLKALKEKLDGLDRMRALLGRNQLKADRQYNAESNALLFVGWQPSGSGPVWSNEYYAEIEFMPNHEALSARTIRIDLLSVRKQKIRVALNGKNQQG